MSDELSERARAMIHDLIVAITEGRKTTEDEPVPKNIGLFTFSRAVEKAITHHEAARAARNRSAEV